MERIIKFKTNEKSWNKQLEPNDIFSSNYFIRGCFYFYGNIDIENFINSLDQSFNCGYEILLGNLKLDEKDKNLYISNSANQEIEILEIKERENELIQDYNFVNEQQQLLLLPSKTVSSEQQYGLNSIHVNLNSMKMCALKLTTFNNGFIIGYNISHSLFDQAAVFYYFKFLSEIYSNGKTINLKPPQLVDYSIFDKLGRIKFNDLNEACNYAIKNPGFFYCLPNSSETINNLKLFSNNSIIQIHFNSNQLDKLKSNVGSGYLSKNDIVTGTLLKLFTFTNLLSNNDIFYLKYICNMRKYANLGEETLGNIYHYYCIPLKVSDARRLSILELSQISRQNVKKINCQQFINDIEWYKYILNKKHDLMDYFSQSIYFTLLSNWTQFSYDQIKFNNSSPYSLRTICAASIGTNYITFGRNEQNEPILSTSISIPPDSINNIIELSKSTNLFKIIISKIKE